MLGAVECWQRFGRECSEPLALDSWLQMGRVSKLREVDMLAQEHSTVRPAHREEVVEHMGSLARAVAGRLDLVVEGKPELEVVEDMPRVVAVHRRGTEPAVVEEQQDTDEVAVEPEDSCWVEEGMQQAVGHGQTATNPVAPESRVPLLEAEAEPGVRMVQDLRNMVDADLADVGIELPPFSTSLVCRDRYKI